MKTPKTSWLRGLAVVFGVAVLFGLTAFGFYLFPATYSDWILYLRPAALNPLNPYSSAIFNPPWLFIFLYPFAVLPERVGAAVLMAVTLLIIFIYEKVPWKILLVAVSAPALRLFTLGQLDGLVLLGLLIPAGLGLPILFFKPQNAFLAALRRINPWSALVLGTTLIISWFIWGPWWSFLLQRGQSPVGWEHNISLFPWSILPGIFFLWLGLKRHSDGMLCAASLCFTPYFMLSSTIVALAALIRETSSKFLAAALVVSSWIILLAA